MTTHVTDCSNQAYLCCCRVDGASVWIATGIRLLHQRTSCRQVQLDEPCCCKLHVHLSTCNRLSLHASVLLGGQCMTHFCQTLTAEKQQARSSTKQAQRHAEKQKATRGFPCNETSNVCGICQISQKVQPGKKNVKMKLST